jgi:hypothetical protein
LAGFNEAQVRSLPLALRCTSLHVIRCSPSTVSQVHQLMIAAFKDPIPAAKPLGFRFTVGGGKKARGCKALEKTSKRLRKRFRFRSIR